MRLGIAAKLATGVVVAVLVAAGSAVAAQASASSVPGGTLSVRVTSDPLVAQDASAPSPARAACAPAPNAFNRTQLCYLKNVKLIVLLNRNPVGFATFTATHSIQLNTKSRSFTEQVSIGGVRLVGNAGGIHVALGDTCSSPCSPVGNNFPVGQTLRSGLHGTLTFHDSVGAGKTHTARNKYVWLFVKTGFTPGSVTYSTPLNYRCDFAITRFPAGCVFPEFTPTMTSMLRLPNIAANIARIQSHGGHYGRFGSGHPLHHITNPAQQRRNHDFLCPPSRPRPPGKQCDEYPFASTREGGSALPASSRGWAWVPAAEQRSQGGLINAFYNANRVLNGDAFWVQA